VIPDRLFAAALVCADEAGDEAGGGSEASDGDERALTRFRITSRVQAGRNLQERADGALVDQ
jgi:hypothetical protein